MTSDKQEEPLHPVPAAIIGWLADHWKAPVPPAGEHSTRPAESVLGGLGIHWSRDDPHPVPDDAKQAERERRQREGLPAAPTEEQCLEWLTTLLACRGEAAVMLRPLLAKVVQDAQRAQGPRERGQENGRGRGPER